MKKALVFAPVLALWLSGCGAPIEYRFEDPPPELAEPFTAGVNPLPPQPNICWITCPRTPDLEPLGQVCWLTGQRCTNGVLTCYYHCEPVEEDLQPY